MLVVVAVPLLRGRSSPRRVRAVLVGLKPKILPFALLAGDMANALSLDRGHAELNSTNSATDRTIRSMRRLRRWSWNLSSFSEAFVLNSHDALVVRNTNQESAAHDVNFTLCMVKKQRALR